MMKAYVEPPPGMSTAMYRIALVLSETVPSEVTIVDNEEDADVLVLHVIGLEHIEYRKDKRVAVIQYCHGSTADSSVTTWRPLWERAVATWSYYDLRNVCPRFYYAPLGISGSFTEPYTERERDFGIITSGYVAGPGAEAIEECILAAEQEGLRSIHLGPRPTRMSPTTKCLSTYEAFGGFIPDDRLAMLYRRSRYVSGLRFGEGFELPAAEGLACGARPIMFDRPDARAWFDGHAVFVPEYNGYSLIRELRQVFKHEPDPVTPEERAAVLKKFDWTDLANGFWAAIKEGL